MTITFSALSLKRNRSSSTNMKTKESKLNAIFNKIASPFIQSNENDNTHKKRRQQQQQHNRRSSLSLFIDYFRTEDDHPFANDALFEQNRYRQQKKEQRQQSCIYPPNNTTSSILLKSPNNKNITQHRHTNSSPIIYSKKKKSNHIRHYSHVSCISSSNITVKSEDLTAKEFADMAGIRILSEDELDENSFIDMNSYTTQSKKICTHCGDEEENDIIMVPSLLNVSRTCHSSIINSSLICPPEEEDDEPQIWDNQFWKKPGQHEQEQQQPIMPTLKKDTIIKKGRFEIHISSSGTTSPSTSLPIKKSTEVIEWKRKSRPTNTLKHQLTAV